MTTLVMLAIGLLGGGTLGAIIVAWLKRGLTEAESDERHANANKTEVETLREIIAEVRASEAKKDARIDQMEKRLDKLEERERHALTRAAVHEAWDTLAFNFIAAQDRHFPTPPPLTVPPE